MPLWYPHVFSGYPVLGQPVGGPLAPLAQLRHIVPPQVALTISFMLMLFAAALGTYHYLKALGMSKYAAAFGAIAYQFAGNLASAPMAGHLGRASSIALFPFMMYFIHQALETKKFAYFIIFSLITALTFYEGHFQLTYYALLTIAGYVIYYLVANRKKFQKRELIKVLGYGLCSIIMIAVLMAVVWLPVLNSLKLVARGSARGYEYAISWALPPLEIMDLMVPTFSGILENYWGTNAFKLHTEYFGVIVLLMAIMAVILYWRKPYVKFFALLALVSILVSIGGSTPFFKFAYNVLPLFKLTRAPALAFYLAVFSFVCISSIGFDGIFIKKEISKRQFIISALSTAVIFILALVIFTSIGRSVAASREKLFENNLTQLYRGAAWSLIMIAVCLSLIYMSMRKPFKIGISALILIILSVTTQLFIVRKFLPKAPAPEKYYTIDDVSRFIKKDSSVYRVFPCVFPTPYGDIGYAHAKDTYLLYQGIQSAGGYAPNPLQRYQDLIGAGTSVMFVPIRLYQYPALIDMLNLKYLIAMNLPADMSAYDPGIQRSVLPIKTFLSRYRLAYAGYQYTVYQNDSVLPRAYIVSDFETVEAGKVLDRLGSASFDRYSSVVLEDDPGLHHVQGKKRYVPAEIATYTANRVVCKTDCPFAGFLVLADNWHPDWKVFVDGQEKELYRANYTFRAVHVEAGTHEVAFVYSSYYFALGSVITIIGIAIILAIFFPRLLWLLVSRTGALLRNRAPQPSQKERSDTERP